MIKVRRGALVLGIVMMAIQFSGCYVDVNHHYHPWWHHHDDVVVVHP